MNSVIIIDPDKKSYKRLFFNIANNSIKVSGYHLDGEGKKKISYDDLVELKQLFFPDDLKKQNDQDGYKVYVDQFSLKHFIKNNKEDYEKFFTSNDLGAYRTAGEYDYKVSSPKSYKIKQGKRLYIIKVASLSLVTSLLFILGTSYYTAKKDVFNTALTDQIEIVETTEGLENESIAFDNVYLSVDELCELLDSSKLSDEHLQYIYNENLLKDIFPYYKGTVMEHLIQERLDGLRVEYFDSYDRDDGVLLGYYDYMDRNVIHLNSQYDYTFSLGHEFIHVLQNPTCTSDFFLEATADLISYEYLKEDFDSYPEIDYNMKLLINTIGPELVWDYVFSGDFKRIDDILKTNLNEYDYNRIIKLFNSKDFTDEYHEELSDLIFTLYRNMYQQEMMDNPNIFDREKGLVNKTYFNEDKMPEREYSSYYDEYTDNIKTMFPYQSIRKNSSSISR